jgi:DNA ligase (NAD+)
MTDRQQRLLDLRDILNRHNYNYYVLNAPEISDKDFDMLMKELEQLEAEFPEMADPYSPTQRVGSDLSEGFEQVPHIYPMLSLGNTYSIEEVDEWFHRVSTGLGGEPFEVVGEMKYDGTSI